MANGEVYLLFCLHPKAVGDMQEEIHQLDPQVFSG